jgi:hypothetical protein
VGKAERRLSALKDLMLAPVQSIPVHLAQEKLLLRAPGALILAASNASLGRRFALNP